MGEFYKSKKLKAKSTLSIMQNIKRVEADNDWDGISSAAQIKFYYPDVNVSISRLKTVDSDSDTLVLDKWTNGKGWIIDHHTTNPYINANVLLFSISGQVPTSRLTYMFLDKSRPADIFLSATAEITDGLYKTGLKDGSMHELFLRFPHYFRKSTLRNQFLRQEEIFTIADILAIIANENPEYSLKLGLRFYDKLPKDHNELKSMLDPKRKEMINAYVEFINNFDISDFEKVRINGKNVKIIDRRSLGKYYIPVLDLARRKEVGDYIMFKGDAISIRTDDSKLLECIFNRLNEICQSKGGRVDAFGMKLKASITYEQFKKLVSD